MSSGIDRQKHLVINDKLKNCVQQTVEKGLLVIFTGDLLQAKIVICEKKGSKTFNEPSSGLSTAESRFLHERLGK
ncbi:hypothetical protein G9A89_011527 [Geosiphon pyriformis]|nr:hypothetical protein G9A89_011527 [Geosiphon pyriformis]